MPRTTKKKSTAVHTQGSHIVDLKGITVHNLGLDGIDIGRFSLDGSRIGEIAIESIRGNVAYSGRLEHIKLKLTFYIRYGVHKCDDDKSRGKLGKVEKQIRDELRLSDQQIAQLKAILAEFYKDIPSSKTHVKAHPQGEIDIPLPPIPIVNHIPLEAAHIPLKWDKLSFRNLSFGANTALHIGGFSEDVGVSDVHTQYASQSGLLSMDSLMATQIAVTPNTRSDFKLSAISQTFHVDQIPLSDIHIDQHVDQQDHGGFDVYLGEFGTPDLNIPLICIPFVGCYCAYIAVGVKITLMIGNWHTNSVNVVGDIRGIAVRNVDIDLLLQNIVLRRAGADGVTVAQLSLVSARRK